MGRLASDSVVEDDCLPAQPVSDFQTFNSIMVKTKYCIEMPRGLGVSIHNEARAHNSPQCHFS
jgi:hypothetical protein